ncbi:response regulator [Acidisphaera sp. L21]|uniref:response regulator n=1 Tax=Acidisphaera sp. L21 TaxID=1641851 RepID=UPI00131E64F6|nr:response regulator [Acidisphaera sp. L21]
MCVLVVEDEFLIAMLVEDALTESGHSVMVAPDGQRALDLLDERPGHFTGLVTDYHMPSHLSGGDVIKRMRVLYPTIPMLLTTALGNATTPDWRQEMSVELMLKPYEVGHLVQHFRHLLT